MEYNCENRENKNKNGEFIKTFHTLVLMKTAQDYCKMHLMYWVEYAS